jgi:hypothetical protein
MCERALRQVMCHNLARPVCCWFSLSMIWIECVCVRCSLSCTTMRLPRNAQRTAGPGVPGCREQPSQPCSSLQMSTSPHAANVGAMHLPTHHIPILLEPPPKASSSSIPCGLSCYPRTNASGRRRQWRSVPARDETVAASPFGMRFGFLLIGPSVSWAAKEGKKKRI